MAFSASKPRTGSASLAMQKHSGSPPPVNRLVVRYQLKRDRSPNRKDRDFYAADNFQVLTADEHLAWHKKESPARPLSLERQAWVQQLEEIASHHVVA